MNKGLLLAMLTGVLGAVLAARHNVDALTSASLIELRNARSALSRK
jgi:hypothetical protein